MNEAEEEMGSFVSIWIRSVTESYTESWNELKRGKATSSSLKGIKVMGFEGKKGNGDG